MIGQSMRQDTDYRVTIEQIGRLERALLSMRQSADGLSDALDVIALIQYQEIARLRAELDTSLGFAANADYRPTPPMIEQNMRQDTDYRVTIEQIGRLERILLSTRQTAVGSPYVLDTIARIQYQEIARLRAELDAALGFAANASHPSTPAKPKPAHPNPTHPRKDTRPQMPTSHAQAILDLAKRSGALMFGDFQLSAGGASSYYFDGRIVTLDPQGAYLVAQAFLPILRDCRAHAIAGPTLGADPIVAAVAMASHIDGGAPIPGLIVRKEAKEHGGKRAIEGPLTPGARVAVVDDACSTASSLFHAIEAVEAAGCEVVKTLAILDRRMGGSDELRRRGYDFAALLEADADGNITPANAHA